MSNARDGQGQEWDDTAADAPQRPTAGSRRRLLGGAAGGVVLGASGLVLPAWLVEEAEADEHPVRRVQQRKEQKRRKHGHHRHRRHKRRRAGKSRGRGIFRDVAIYVRNYRAVPVQVEGWVLHFEHNNQQDPYYKPTKDWDWATIPAKAADGSHSERAFIGDDEFVAVRIGTDVVITGENHWFTWPEAAILSGGWDAKHGWNPQGETLAHEERMAVYDSIAWNGIKLMRFDDTPKHIVFAVDLT